MLALWQELCGKVVKGRTIKEGTLPITVGIKDTKQTHCQLIFWSTFIF
jgi:hypothetical protein